MAAHPIFEPILSGIFRSHEVVNRAAAPVKRPSFVASELAARIRELRYCDNEDVVIVLQALIARVENDKLCRSDRHIVAQYLEDAADEIGALE